MGSAIRFPWHRAVACIGWLILHASLGAVTIDAPTGLLSAVVEVTEERDLVYSLTAGDRPIVTASPLGITIDGQTLGEDVQLGKAKLEAVEYDFALPGRSQKYKAQGTTLTLPILAASGDVQFVLQAQLFDDGFAFRYIIPGKGVRRVLGELTAFTFPADSEVWYFERENAWKLKTHAGEWMSAPLESMPSVSSQGPVQGLPLVVELPDDTGYAVVAEAALFRYSGLRLKAAGNGRFYANFTEKDGFELEKTICTPWRVVQFSQDLNGLVNSHLVARLCPEFDTTLFGETNYIRPGRSVWRWWSQGTGTPAEERGMVGHAARLGFEYTTIDDGWEKWPQAWKALKDICDFAKPQDVGVFVWKHIDDVRNPANNYQDLREFLDDVQKVGGAGVKFDFFNGESLQEVLLIENVLRHAAKRHLLVNLHGVGKSTGEYRTYPNLLTREGIRGLELNRMNEGPITPSHNASLPFTRFVVGPADYTPLTIQPSRMGKTTIAHQLATLVCFDSPLQTIAEHPENILVLKDARLRQLIEEVPAVWDETLVLPKSRIGRLAVMARRCDDDWFVAGINGGPATNCKVDLGFLPARKRDGLLVTDQSNGTYFADVENQVVSAHSKLSFRLAEGGGFVLWLPSAMEMQQGNSDIQSMRRALDGVPLIETRFAFLPKWSESRVDEPQSIRD